MMRPSLLPELERYEHLAKLVEVQVDMQFADLWTLLQLPRHEQGLHGGCNLTAATLVFNLVAGVSVLFYQSSMEELESRRGRDKRFMRDRSPAHRALTTRIPVPILPREPLEAARERPVERQGIAIRATAREAVSRDRQRTSADLGAHLRAGALARRDAAGHSCPPDG
jgi:hypothetical protein